MSGERDSEAFDMWMIELGKVALTSSTPPTLELLLASRRTNLQNPQISIRSCDGHKCLDQYPDPPGDSARVR